MAGGVQERHKPDRQQAQAKHVHVRSDGQAGRPQKNSFQAGRQGVRGSRVSLGGTDYSSDRHVSVCLCCSLVGHMKNRTGLYMVQHSSHSTSGRGP